MKPRPEFRPCGECDACCTTHAVADIGKAADCRCPHALGAGCSVYEQRPEPCRDFHCLWRQGLVGKDERDRPDRVGVVFDLGQRLRDGTPVMVAHELVAGGAYLGRAAWLIERLSRKIAVVVRSPGPDGMPRIVEGGRSRPLNPSRVVDLATGLPVSRPSVAPG